MSSPLTQPALCHAVAYCKNCFLNKLSALLHPLPLLPPYQSTSAGATSDKGAGGEQAEEATGDAPEAKSEQQAHASTHTTQKQQHMQSEGGIQHCSNEHHLRHTYIVHTYNLCLHACMCVLAQFALIFMCIVIISIISSLYTCLQARLSSL